MRKHLKISYILLFVFNSIVNLGFASVSFNGAIYSPIKITPPSSTGISDIFVLNSLNNVSITYSAEAGEEIEWMIFSSLGGGFAEPVTGLVKNGANYTLSSPIGNSGYIIRENNKNYIFWLIDYSSYQLILNNIYPDIESGCDATILTFDGKAAPIYYYTVNGRQEVLSREIDLEYENQIWDETSSSFIKEKITTQLASINDIITIIPPIYCETPIDLDGDRFLKEWGLSQNISCRFNEIKGVDVHTTVESDDSDHPSADNQISANTGGLGGSAPYTASFFSFVTDGVVHYEWQISEDPGFEEISYRFNDEDLTYTFTNEGDMYIRFVGSNTDGSCESIGDTYKVSIGSSELLIPNVFSPNGDGINDIWKVSYRSLLEFRCSIFDKHGHQIYHFENPEDGWNGKNGSKFVSPGVYFYVIEAVGADGKRYKKSGDINILNSYQSSGSIID